MEKISIIVPIYNAEKTLKKCINSVINQNFQEWELLLIDDGSTDSSLNLCKEYEKIDSRIKAFSKQNGGVSSARNYGIEKVNGDFIIFIDSDDYIENNLLQSAINAYKNHKTDLIIWGYIMERKNERIQYNVSMKYLKNKYEILNELINIKNISFYATPCNKLYKTSIIKNNNVKFKEQVSLGEDLIFVLDYIKNINNIYFLPECLSVYSIMENSLCRKDIKNIWDIQYFLYKQYISTFDGYTKYNFNNFIGFFFRSISISINTAISNKWNYKRYKKLCNDIISTDEFKKINLKNIKLGMYTKIIYILLKLKLFWTLKCFINFKNLLSNRLKEKLKNINKGEEDAYRKFN